MSCTLHPSRDRVALKSSAILPPNPRDGRSLPRVMLVGTLLPSSAFENDAMPPQRTPTRAACWLLMLWFGCAQADGATFLFQEDFQNLPLQTSPTYGVPNAFTHDPPPGWDRFDLVPGSNDPLIGVPEWEGWSFARQSFWQTAGRQFGDVGGRDIFRPGGRMNDPLGNIVAVADPDLWNDPTVGDPANNLGYYNSFLLTPEIDLNQVGDLDNRMVFSFASSWMGVECCDDGANLDTEQRFRNNQRATITMHISGGPSVEILRWEAAPFYDDQGRPTNEPVNSAGIANTPNPFHYRFDIDELVTIPVDFLTELGGGGPIGVLEGGEGLALGGSGSGGGVSFEFAMEGAGDDAWWAIDKLALVSYSDLFGDMNHNDMLDVGDYDAFALGMLDEDQYRCVFGGIFPGDNGSIDSFFNYDDIPDFLAAMEGVGAPASAFAMSFFAAIPEPSAGVVALCGLGAAALRRTR